VTAVDQVAIDICLWVADGERLHPEQRDRRLPQLPPRPRAQRRLRRDPRARARRFPRAFADWLGERGADLVEADEILGYHLEQAARYKQELSQPDPALAERAGERLATAGRRALRRVGTKIVQTARIVAAIARVTLDAVS